MRCLEDAFGAHSVKNEPAFLVGVFPDDGLVVLNDRADPGNLIEDFKWTFYQQLQAFPQISCASGGWRAVKVRPAVGGTDPPEVIFNGLDPAGLIVDFVSRKRLLEFNNQHFAFRGVVRNKLPIRTIQYLPAFAEADKFV